jgi:hypothetical protein
VRDEFLSSQVMNGISPKLFLERREALWS